MFSSPAVVRLLNKWISIRFEAAGEVFGFGDNSYGQLGIGAEEKKNRTHPTPVKVPFLLLCGRSDDRFFFSKFKMHLCLEHTLEESNEFFHLKFVRSSCRIHSDVSFDQTYDRLRLETQTPPLKKVVDDINASSICRWEYLSMAMSRRCLMFTSSVDGLTRSSLVSIRFVHHNLSSITVPPLTPPNQYLIPVESRVLYATGRNTHGQLGLGIDVPNVDELTCVDSICFRDGNKSIVSLATGSEHALVLLSGNAISNQ